MARQSIPKFPKEFQKQVDTACKNYSKPHKSDDIGKLPLASVALQAVLLRNPSHPIDNDGRAKALKHIIRVSLENLKATEPHTHEWDLYLCLYSYIREQDPLTGISFVNRVELYLKGAYGFAKGTYHRHKNEGLRRLSYEISSTLAQQTIWQEAVPKIGGFAPKGHDMGREAELAYYRQQLESEGLAVIEGVDGVGKTTLAAQLAQSFKGQRPVCWQTIRPGLNDHPHSLLYGWAAFLAQQDYPQLWMVMRTVATNVNPDAKRKGLSLSNLLPILREGLAKVAPLLCLDKLEELEKGKHAQECCSLLEFVQQEPSTSLLLISEQRPRLSQLGDYELLGGLSSREVGRLMARRKIELTSEQVELVTHYTLGNPSLLKLWATYTQLQQVELSTSLDKLRDSQAATSLLREIVSGLTASQQRAARLLALSRRPLDNFLLQEPPKELPPLTELAIEADDFTTLSRSGLLHNPLETQWTLSPLLKEHLQSQLMPKNAPPSDEAMAYHNWLAGWWTLQGNMLESAYHHIQMENEEEALCSLAEQQDLLIEQGFAPAMTPLLASIQVDHLSPPVRQLLRKVRTELSQLLGEYGAAEAEIQAAADEATTGLEQAQAERARGELAKRRGNFPQASESYQHALRLLAPTQLTLEAWLHRDLAWSLMQQGELDEAWNEGQRTRIALENTLGVIARRRGDFEQAEQHYQQGIAIAQECGESRELMRLRNNLAILYGTQKKNEEAQALYQKNLQESEKIYNLEGQAISLMGLGDCYLDMGEHEAAISHFTRAWPIFTTLGNAYGQMLARFNLARSYLHVGQLNVASQHAEAAIKIDKAQVPLTAYAEARRVYAEVLLAQGDTHNAQSMAQQALETRRLPGSSDTFHDPYYAKLTCETLVRIHTALDQTEQAEQYAALAQQLEQKLTA